MNAQTPDIPREGVNPANVGSRGELVIGLAVISAALAGVGLLTSAVVSLWPLAAIIVVLGILSGLAGVGLGLARGRTGPATAAGGAALFGVILLVIVLIRAWGGDEDGTPEPREPGQPLVSPVQTD